MSFQATDPLPCLLGILRHRNGFGSLVYGLRPALVDLCCSGPTLFGPSALNRVFSGIKRKPTYAPLDQHKSS